MRTLFLMLLPLLLVFAVVLAVNDGQLETGHPKLSPALSPLDQRDQEEEDDDDPGCKLTIESKNQDGDPGERGEHGFPGPVGYPGPPGLPGAGKRKVVFFAALSQNLGPRDGQRLIYREMTVNIGNAYNVLYGTFTTPVTGTYVFNVVLAPQGGREAGVQMHHVNPRTEMDKIEVDMEANSIPNWATSSQTVYLSLEKGDQIYLKAKEGMDSYFYAGRYTTFSGHLIH